VLFQVPWMKSMHDTILLMINSPIAVLSGGEICYLEIMSL